MSQAVAASPDHAAHASAAALAHGLPATGPSPDVTAPLTTVGGIEITGIDLAAPLNEQRRCQLNETFRAHPIVVFRNQHLSKDQQHAFTLIFGEMEDRHVGRLTDSVRYTPVHTVSNLDANDRPTAQLQERGNYFWHTDKSYHDIPSLLTMLHAVELPPDGGETQFANMAMA